MKLNARIWYQEKEKAAEAKAGYDKTPIIHKILKENLRIY